MSTAILENRLTKTEDRLDRLEQLILQQSINIAKSQQETAQQSANIAKSQQETAQLRIELAKSNTRMEQGFQRMEQGFAEFKENITQIEKKNAQSSAEFKENITQIEKENAQGFAELRKSHKELNKKLKKLSSRLGTIVEDFVAPSLEKIFFEVTDLPDNSETIVQVRRKGRHPVTRLVREFDAILESEKYLLVNENQKQTNT